MSKTTNLKGSVNSADECIDDVNVVMAVPEDENKEDLKEVTIGDPPQKQLQICSRHHHLF